MFKVQETQLQHDYMFLNLNFYVWESELKFNNILLNQKL